MVKFVYRWHFISFIIERFNEDNERPNPSFTKQPQLHLELSLVSFGAFRIKFQIYFIAIWLTK